MPNAVPNLAGALTRSTRQLLAGSGRVMCCRVWRRVLAARNPVRVVAQLARTELGASAAQAADLGELTAAQARLLALAMSTRVCPRSPSPFGLGIARVPSRDPYIQVTLAGDDRLRLRLALRSGR